MSAEIQQEWRDHESRYTRKWLAGMYARELVYRSSVGLDHHLRNRVSRDLPGHEDLHVVGAAHATDRRVASQDERARRDFRRVSVSISGTTENRVGKSDAGGRGADRLAAQRSSCRCKSTARCMRETARFCRGAGWQRRWRPADAGAGHRLPEPAGDRVLLTATLYIIHQAGNDSYRDKRPGPRGLAGIPAAPTTACCPPACRVLLNHYHQAHSRLGSATVVQIRLPAWVCTPSASSLRPNGQLRSTLPRPEPSV